MTKPYFGCYEVKLFSCCKLILLCLFISGAGACQKAYSGIVGLAYQLPGKTFQGWQFQEFEWMDYQGATLAADNVQRDKGQGWNPAKWSPELWWRKPDVAKELAGALLAQGHWQDNGDQFVTFRIVNGLKQVIFRSHITPLVAFQHNDGQFLNPRVGVTGALMVNANTPIFGVDINGFRDVINGNQLQLTFVMARRLPQQPPPPPPGPEGPNRVLAAGGGFGAQPVPEPNSAAIFGVISLAIGAFRGLRSKRAV